MQHELTYFNISWLSKTDGSGLRVVLFLQGCSLDCVWCHSPHSQPNKCPLLFFESLCTNCGRCAEVCSNGVHLFNDGKHILQRDACIQCGKCVESCPQSSFYNSANALSLPTKTDDVDTLFSKLKPQLDLFRDKGGITFSGGEPLLQVNALTVLAKKCKEAGINTVLETSGSVALRSIKTILIVR